MTPTRRWLAATAVLMSAWLSIAGTDLRANAQETPSSGVPAPDIIPRPNSGRAPSEAGDPGGALQLLVLALVVLAICGAVIYLVRQSRRARSSAEH